MTSLIHGNRMRTRRSVAGEPLHKTGHKTEMYCHSLKKKEVFLCCISWVYIIDTSGYCVTSIVSPKFSDLVLSDHQWRHKQNNSCELCDTKIFGLIETQMWHQLLWQRTDIYYPAQSEQMVTRRLHPSFVTTLLQIWINSSNRGTAEARAPPLGVV